MNLDAHAPRPHDGPPLPPPANADNADNAADDADAKNAGPSPDAVEVEVLFPSADAPPAMGMAAEAGSSFAQPDDKDLVEPENPLPPAVLADLPGPLRAAAARAGWNELTPVQARAIPYLRACRDLMAQSRTGSGKTGAFILPILERIRPKRATCQALTLVPTRELARQVAEEALLLAGDAGIRVAGVYGGVGYGPQLEALAAGCHIVVGTPGRVLDHLLRGSLVLDDLDTLVFDEADRMLSMGFYPDVKAIQTRLPARRVNAYMFSATYPSRVRRLAGEFLLRPGFLSLSADGVHISHIEHAYYLVPGLEKDRALIRIIEFENPLSALIFCNTKTRVHYVATVLRRFGHNADELTSDLPQPAREEVLGRLHAGTLRFLVATDLAARGLDIRDLACVVQYEPPEDPEAYVHRAGRTGRAGAGGLALALVSPGVELMELRRIGKQFDINFVERIPPSEDDVAALVGQAMVAALEAKLRVRDRLEVERMRRFLPLVRSLAEQGDDASAILAMLLDDHYHQITHQPQLQLPPPPVAPPPMKPEHARERDRSRSRERPGRRGGGRRGGNRR